MDSLPVRFVWDHGGGQVWACITGPDGDSRAVELIRNRAGVFEVIVVLPVGRYEYRSAHSASTQPISKLNHTTVKA